MIALEYKLENDPYCKDVQLDQNEIRYLPTTPTNLSHMLRHIETSILKYKYNYEQPDNLHRDFIDQDVQWPSSFVATLPNAHTKV